jgi:hypothetical protein
MSKIPGTFQPNSPLRDTRNPLTPDEKKSRAEFLKKHQHQRSLSLTPGKRVKTEAPIKSKKSELTEAMSGLNALFDVLARGEVSDISKQVRNCFATGAVDASLVSAVLAERSTVDQTNIANAAALVMANSDDSATKRLMTAVRDVTEQNLATQAKTAPAVEDLLLELGSQTKGGTLRLRELLSLADDELRIGGEEEIRPRINAALEKLTPQQTIAVASSFIKLDPTDKGIYPMLGHYISAATSRVAPQHFIEECLAYRSPPIGALETMEKIELSSNDLTEVDPMYMHDFLANAIGPALDGLSPGDLNRLHERLSERDIPQDVSVVNRFCRLVARRRELLKLLPQPVVIPKT